MRPARVRASRRVSKILRSAAGVLRSALVESSVWSLPVARVWPVEGAEDGAELAVFFGGGGAEGLGGGVLRGAEVAVAAGAEAVGGVAEVLDEGGHAALRGFGELDHAVDLVAAEGDLVVVAFAPCCACGSVFGGADVAGHVDGGCALGDEFFDGFVEGLGVHL